MLVIAGSIVIDEESLAEALPAARRMIEETRKEPGCRHYGFYQDVLAPGRIQIYEEWDDAESLAAHGASAHMAAWRGVLSGLKLLSRDLKVMTVRDEDVKPL